MQQLNYVEILRLAYGKGMGVRRLAQTLGYPKTTVGRFLQRFKESGIAYPLPEGIGNIELKERLYQPTQEKDPSFVLPDYDTIHKLLSLKGYNLKKLWERYRLECDADGNRPYLYSQFCRHYADFVREKRRTLSLERIPGDEMQVDFTGLTLFLKDDISGDNIPAYVFIAILSYSNYTYLEAMASMNSANWIRANTHALQYFGGVPAFVTPDNAKVAVTENKDWLDPKIQQAYLEWASYYGTVVLPARVRHPKDKSGVEGAVRIVSARILSDLRERTFFSIDEVNNALWEAMDAFNAEPFARKPGSRFSWHQEELGKLSPLPPVAFEFSERAKATVHNDYHVAYDYGYYSAPYELVRQESRCITAAGWSQSTRGSPARASAGPILPICLRITSSMPPGAVPSSAPGRNRSARTPSWSSTPCWAGRSMRCRPSVPAWESSILPRSLPATSLNRSAPTPSPMAGSLTATSRTRWHWQDKSWLLHSTAPSHPFRRRTGMC